MPVPESATVRGLPAASSVIVTVPLLDPPAEGPKVTLTRQLAPAASELPQVFVWAKSPLAAILVMVRAALPVLESVTVWPELVVPTV
jgi:hypothetical protein